MKKIVTFCLIIFVFALLARIASYYHVLNSEFGSYQYYQGIGSGSDSDFQINNALFSIRGSNLAETWSHYDYIFLIPLITFLIKTFGYIRGIEYAMYLVILLGSLVPVIIFLFLARRTPYLLGSVIAGLALALNPLMISVSGGRFILDTLVQFIFAIFIVCYVNAVEKKSFFWLIAVGVMAVIQGFNKPFLMVNDLALFLVFPIFILIKKIQYKEKFPYVLINWNISKKSIFYSFIPTIIYLAGNIGLEAYEHIVFHSGYFLSDIFLSKQADSSGNVAMRDSLVLAKGPLEKLRNIVMLTLMTIQQLLYYINLNIFYFVTVIGFYILSKKNKALWFRWIIKISVVFLAVYYLLTKFFFLNAPFTSVPQSWTIETFITFTIFTVLILLFMQDSVLMLATTASQIPYLVAVGLTFTGGIYPRHYVTLVIWLVLCTSLFLDSFMLKPLTKFHPRAYRWLLIVVFLTFTYPAIQTLFTFQSVMSKEMKDREYLSWVATKVPANGYIAAGTGENFIDIAKITGRSIIYNAYFDPVVANYTDSAFQVKDFDFFDPKFPGYIKLFTKYTKEGKLYITDLNKSGWDQLFTNGSKVEIPKNIYSLKIVAKNPQTNRFLYQVILNNKETNDSDQQQQ